MEQNLNIDPSVQYDVIELASKGIYYENKKKTIRVSYLTAADENILTSPNLLASGKVIDELLKRKVIDKDIKIEDLVDEDRETILIFLRNTAFGSEYTLKVNDPKTKEDFNVKINLEELKFKEFNLKEDENGEYSYFLPKCKTNITFKFLNKKQEDELNKLSKEWKEKDGAVIPVATKRLEMLIKSVGGDRDIMYIHNFIHNTLPLKDSKDFKKYVTDNKPGLDLTKQVNTPSGDTIQVEIGFGVEFFRPFYGI